MEDLDAALGTIASGLATGQIGSPLAARIVVHLVADHGRLERLAARSLDTACGWFASDVDELTALGSVEAGHISLLARFAGGQSALVSVGSAGAGQGVLEILVTGNRGVLAWEAECGKIATGDAAREPELSQQAAKLLAEVRNSLRANPRLAPPVPEGAPFATTRRALKPPYGVLLVSGDHTHQPQYAAALTADKRCKLVGLTDEANISPRRRQRNEELAQRLGIPVLADLKQALARDDVHIVSICAEPQRRGQIIVQAAHAGKHLYLDKPLAGSLADADQIVAACRASSVVTHMWSFVHSPAAELTREIVTSGRLGDLVAVHCDLTFAKGPAGTATLLKPRRENAVPKEYEVADSKRELTNIGVYPLVLLLWLTGCSVRRVRATTGNYFFREHQANDMEDFGQMLLEFDGGLVATISVGRTGWRSHPASGLNRICLIGTKDTAVVDADRPRVAVWADVDGWTAPERDPGDPMGMWGGPKPAQYTPKPKQAWIMPTAADPNEDARYFLDCIAAGRESDVSAALAAKATEVLLAAYQSAAGGRMVELPLARERK